MTEKLKQITKDEIAKLPKEAQEAINAYEWAKAAEEIGKKFLLSDIEINEFQAETLIVLTGLEDSYLYAQNIENDIGTSKEDAEKMAEEANQKIFIPITNIMDENIKKNLKNKSPNWQQSVDFILSGGDYSAFVEKRETAKPETEKSDAVLKTPVSPPTLAEIQASEKKENASNISQIEDINHKLVI